MYIMIRLPSLFLPCGFYRDCIAASNASAYPQPAKITTQLQPHKMPTATRYFDRPVTNFGPLTTTFTAPSSCATQAHPNLQWYYHPRNNTAGAAGISGGQCFGVRYDDCLPSGTAFDDAFNTIYPDGYMQYFSPGLHCPSGWTTAGTVPGSGAKPTGGLHAVPSGASGIFTEDPWPFAAKSNASGFGRVAFLPQVKAFPGILEENETLAWCCPRWVINSAFLYMLSRPFDNTHSRPILC